MGSLAVLKRESYALKKLRPEDLGIEMKEVRRYLGYKEGKEVPARTLRVIGEQLARAYELFKPQGAYCFLPAEALAEHALFADAEVVAFAVGTLGEEAEAQISAYFQARAAREALVLDAIASVATEALADFLNTEITQWAGARGMRATRRFSPGYGPWDLTGQMLLFSYLNPQELGLTLTPALMMVPRKSVSFACKLGYRPMEEVNQGKCVACPQRGRCLYQKACLD